MATITKVLVSGVIFRGRGLEVDSSALDKVVNVMSRGWLIPHVVDTTEEGEDVTVLVPMDDYPELLGDLNKPLYSVTTAQGECLYMGTSAEGCIEIIVDKDNVVDCWY